MLTRFYFSSLFAFHLVFAFACSPSSNPTAYDGNDATVPQGSFSLSIASTKNIIKTGSTLSLLVDITRGVNFNDDVVVSLNNVPEEVIATSLGLSPTIQKGILQITATKKAALGSYNLELVGTGGGQTVKIPLQLVVEATSGSLDLSFGVNSKSSVTPGVVVEELPKLAEIMSPIRVLVTPAGKILVGMHLENTTPTSVPSIALIQYNSDGTRDINFNAQGDFPGIRTKLYPNGGVRLSDIRIRQDGKILILASCQTKAIPNPEYNTCLGLLNADGSLDTNFPKVQPPTVSNGWKIWKDSSFSPAIYTFSSNRTLVGSSIYDFVSQTTQMQYTLLQSDGSLEPSFRPNNGDWYRLPFFFNTNPPRLYTETLQSLLPTADEKQFVLSVQYSLPSQDVFSGLVRLNLDGNLDTNFGTNGVSAIKIPTHESASSIRTSKFLISAQNQIVLRGFTYFKVGSTASISYWVGRYSASGIPDPSFGTNGFLLDSYWNNYVSSFDLRTIQSDSKPLLSASNGVLSYVLRLSVDGNIDRTFGEQGLSLLSPPQYSIVDLALQNDGKIVTLASSQNRNSTSTISLSRIWP